MKREKQKKVILVGGGTGGHIVPIIEIYKRLKESGENVSVTVVGAGTEVEKHLYKSLGDSYKKITTGKWKRQLTVTNLAEMGKFILGVIQSLWVVFGIRPGVIFAKGGYATLPVVVAAKLMRIPYFIHESDIEMGLVNKIASRWAKKVFVGFPLKFYPDLPVDKLEYSGPIVRSELQENCSARLQTFSFTNDLPVIFVTGGSQGSLTINRNVAKALPELLKRYNVIHQAGANDLSWLQEYKESALSSAVHKRYFLVDFLKFEDGRDLMVDAICLADLVIARAGANTISELAIKGKPMILIPYKHAASDHQTKNARFLEELNAALVISDDKLTPRNIIEKIDELFLNDGRELKLLGHNAMEMYSKNGADAILQTILHQLQLNKKKNNQK
ncbi:MAG: UDP-N-acetylglucosamine--N-acetylmuramyl-(pentapeptide) pyrophosphoryl-undecaprenol N-acetylglucosamine transferase [bacterium ADurb.Bin400]|nr:MAG: UDP-N-acetylglucosamine--N-acetylmuramyl-(pentapeptide) pyrophosphoryl-undecaprenol N-acetylglucosamine transferase [bacterium ADurb.Bin400]